MPFSGKTGNVKWGATPTDIISVRNWRLTNTVDEKVYASSDTAGHKARVAGHEDASGTFEVYQDDTTTITSVMAVGDIDALELYENATLKFALTALIVALDPIVNVEGGDIVGYTVRFGLASGTVTKPA